MKWMSLSLTLVAVACNNPTESNAFTLGNATTDLAESSSGTDGTATDTDASSGDTGSSSTTGPGETTEVDTDAPSSSSSSSGTTGGPVCGNGVTEEGEQCDDADDDEFDQCTSECAVPVCDDRAHNGDETDVDCGGSCQGCGICLACDNEDDCEGSMICGADSLCVVHGEMVVDWADNCGGVIDGAVVMDLPAGTYLATAVMSAGTLWLPPFTPPSTGYFYEIECNAGVSLDTLATPAGVRYATIAEAFMNINATVEEFDFIGGDLVCYRTDATCGDNNGQVEFDLDYVCPE